MNGPFDLVVEGGRVVTPQAERDANVYVRDGVIALVSPERLDAQERYDASGLLVMPGMVDAHVHFMDPGATDREDFPHGSEAALRAGVTTVVEHTHAAPVRTAADLVAKTAHLAERSRCDFGLAAHAWPRQAGRISELAAAGASFAKVFTCTTHGVEGHDHLALLEVFGEAAAAGLPCLVHCEDQELTSAAEATLRAAGRADGGVIPEWRSRDAEVRAVDAVIEAARRTGATVVVAHASHPDILDRVSRARAAGARVFAETCPQYLLLLESEVLAEGPLRKFTPPARARQRDDLAAMWSAVGAGKIDLISSDHAPSTLAQKASGSIWEAPFGLPGIDTTLPLLLDASARGLLTLTRLVDLYARAPADLYGLAGKGRLEPGADADMVLVDSSLRWTVGPEEVRSLAGWSPYSGRSLTGRAVATFARGRLAMERGKVLAQPGDGRFLARRARAAGFF